VVTNAGGPGILAADALAANSLEVPRLSDRTIATLQEFLPAEAGVSNPVDMIASASPESYGRAVRILGNADEIDVVFVIFIPTARADVDDVARELVAAREDIPEDTPIVAVVMTSHGLPEPLRAANIPTFTFPEGAARALGRVGAYARWRRQPLGKVRVFGDIEKEAARRLVRQQLATSTSEDGSLWLQPDAAKELLRSYGIPVARSTVVASAEEAAEVQQRVRWPRRSQAERADPQSRRRRRRAGPEGPSRSPQRSRACASSWPSGGWRSTATASWSRRWSPTGSRW
jgi:acetate---CoA ligase (ADP-forming)